MVFWDGSLTKPRAFFQFLNSSDTRLRVYIKTEIPDASLHIEGWLDVYSGQAFIIAEVASRISKIISKNIIQNPGSNIKTTLGQQSPEIQKTWVQYHLEGETSNRR